MSLQQSLRVVRPIHHGLCSPKSCQNQLSLYKLSWVSVIVICPGSLPVAVIQHSDQKQLVGGGNLYFQVTVHHRGKPEQETKSRPLRQEADKCCLLALSLAHSPGSCPPSFSISSRRWRPHSKLDLPTELRQSRQFLTAMSTDQPDKVKLLVVLGCDKLTINTHCDMTEM